MVITGGPALTVVTVATVVTAKVDTDEGTKERRPVLQETSPSIVVVLAVAVARPPLKYTPNSVDLPPPTSLPYPTDTQRTSTPHSAGGRIENDFMWFLLGNLAGVGFFLVVYARKGK